MSGKVEMFHFTTPASRLSSIQWESTGHAVGNFLSRRQGLIPGEVKMNLWRTKLHLNSFFS